MIDLGSLYTAHRPGLLLLAQARGCDSSTAEDHVQDLFAAVKVAEIEAEKNVGGWLKSRLLWIISKARRKAATSRRGSGADHVSLEEWEGPEPAADLAAIPDLLMMSKELNAELAQILSGLKVCEEDLCPTQAMTGAQRVALHRRRQKLQAAVLATL